MNIANKLRKYDRTTTVFTVSDIKTILSINDSKTVYNALFYATKRQELYKISNGIYSYDQSYSRKELGNKLRTPSYISLYTVLQEEGVIFQPYSSIFLIANRSEKININGQEYIYRKIKDGILLNPLGIKEKEGTNIATKERAICDKIYLDGLEYFDNTENIDWNMMNQLNNEVYSNNSNISKFISAYKK